MSEWMCVWKHQMRFTKEGDDPILLTKTFEADSIHDALMKMSEALDYKDEQHSVVRLSNTTGSIELADGRIIVGWLSRRTPE